ncbi:hypothetical protein HDE_11265 [Halotydeus destructor]|nr:hypothetical protein HDE_11265 [Halotydeus destructor]
MDTDHDVFVFEKNFPLFRALCLESGTNGDDLTLFEQTYRSIAAIAGQFDYQDVKYNGYRMALRAVHKYMVKCTSQRPQGAPSMFLLLNFFLKYTKIIYDKSNNNLEPCDPTTTFKALNEFQEIKSHLVDIIAPYMGTLHSPQSGHYYSFLPALVSLMTAKSPIDLVKRLISKAYRNWTVVDLCFTMSTSDITAIFSIPETKFLLYLHGWYFDLMYRDVCRKTVMLNLESKFVFKVVQFPRVDVLVEKGSGSVSKVRCRLYSNKNFGSS